MMMVKGAGFDSAQPDIRYNSAVTLSEVEG